MKREIAKHFILKLFFSTLISIPIPGLSLRTIRTWLICPLDHRYNSPERTKNLNATDMIISCLDAPHLPSSLKSLSKLSLSAFSPAPKEQNVPYSRGQHGSLWFEMPSFLCMGVNINKKTLRGTEFSVFSRRLFFQLLYHHCQVTPSKILSNLSWLLLSSSFEVQIYLTILYVKTTN